MPYIYQTTFNIHTDDTHELHLSQSLGSSLAYLKAFLANEAGFINARAMASLFPGERIHLILESTWEDWEYLIDHIEKSPFAEQKIMPEFNLDVELKDLATAIYEEVV